MGTVKESVEVAVPLRAAYNQWTQFEEFPSFMEGVERVVQLDERHTHWVTRIGGVQREFDAEIFDQLPDQRVAWRTTGGEVQQQGVVTFDAVAPSRTRVHLTLKIQPEGAAEKAADLLGILSRQARGDLQRFKTFIEKRGTETGQWRGRITPGDT
ncbi:SRPBCC family protein [Streptomyces monomycini]|uniref:SRPBCC family protein n=1 Tax=Streptomyces monomycini TaxID=371720 RepID=UPI0004AAA664|nr:SRPBCC family protein [Streptomyces monomycini]